MTSVYLFTNFLSRAGKLFESGTFHDRSEFDPEQLEYLISRNYAIIAKSNEQPVQTEPQIVPEPRSKVKPPEKRGRGRPPKYENRMMKSDA